MRCKPDLAAVRHAPRRRGYHATGITELCVANGLGKGALYHYIRSKEELFHKQIIIQGILSIQAGDNPRIVESKLLSFLSPKERAHMAPAGGGGGGKEK